MKFVPRRLEKTADISRGETSWPSFVKNVLSVVIVLVLVYVLLGLTGELLARTIPDRWEARLFAGIDPDPDPGPSAEELSRAEAVFRRLLENAEMRPLPYRLYLVPTREPNAFALPGGAVGVTRGLLDDVRSDEGLALVLGHELGHHQERHTLKRIGRALVFSVAAALLFGRNDVSLVDRSLDIAESSYSRRQEREADAFGLRLVYETFGHTEGSLELFERALSQAGEDELRWAAFVRSHPLTEDRLEELRLQQSELAEAR